MTVKHWDVDQLHLRFFQLFVQNCISFLFMKLTHIQVFKKIIHEARIKCFVYKHTPCSFFGCFVCSDIHMTKYVHINT